MHHVKERKDMTPEEKKEFGRKLKAALAFQRRNSLTLQKRLFREWNLTNKGEYKKEDSHFNRKRHFLYKVVY